MRPTLPIQPQTTTIIFTPGSSLHISETMAAHIQEMQKLCLQDKKHRTSISFNHKTTQYTGPDIFRNEGIVHDDDMLIPFFKAYKVRRSSSLQAVLVFYPNGDVLIDQG